MEGLIFALLVALGLVAVDHRAKQQQGSNPPAGTTGPGGSTTGGTSGSSGGPPPPAPALSPGLYPAGTPGAYAVIVRVLGGDGFGEVDATPGGKVYDAATFYYGPGTSVLFVARVNGGVVAFGTAFDHFEGPGVSTRQSMFTSRIGSDGFVNGVFATFGFVGQ